MITIYEQARIIILYIIFGIFSSIIYDTFSLLTIKVKKIIKYIIEIALWLVVTYISTMFIIKNTSIYITLYVFVFFIIGLMIYYFLLKASYRKSLLTTFSFLRKIFLVLYRIVLPLEIINFIKKSLKKKKSKNLLDE